jgi:DNA-binding HxlR family transcriptional regulator
MDDLSDPFCPRYHHAVELIGRRWSGAVLRALLFGRTGYSELRDTVPGLSDTMLATRLRELEHEGIVERTVDHGPPTRTHYLLTPKGRSLEAVICALSDWAETWIPLDEEHRARGSAGAAQDPAGTNPSLTR